MKKLNLLFVALSAGALSSIAVAGPDWVENSDAGSSFETAQPVVGVGASLHTIAGTLTSGRDTQDLEDLYLVQLNEPTLFSVDLRSAPFDTQVYLFRVSEFSLFGQLANNDADLENTGSFMRNFSTDGAEVVITSPGVYALGISVAGRFPIADGGPIFFFGTNTEVSGPDGPGGFSPLAGWSGSGSGGAYTMLLTGTTFFDVPTPGISAAMIAGLAGAARRRRR